ncbi:Hypothetical protein, putative [Bodo saltans]|uniref:Uncharacterized protein n=1 Tax=Bodo saltans TaxID=75058 RepID=A0A0S4JUA1_BODSA|nr:Hypothetical protein, putative [Bodo saltans]|eukprot:CUG94164.1 Hypothetical protein, putative [Bodo saltans]
MDFTNHPSNRPTKKHRSEYVRPATPVHQMHSWPLTCPPEHRRKPTRSESTASSSNSTVGYSSPGRLVFFDDDCVVSSGAGMCWMREPSLLADPLQSYFSSECVARSSQNVAGGVCTFAYQDVTSFAYDRCTPPHSSAKTSAHHDGEDEECQVTLERRSFSPSPAAPPEETVPNLHITCEANRHQPDDAEPAATMLLLTSEEHQWQANAAHFFRQIDARSLRLAPPLAGEQSSCIREE